MSRQVGLNLAHFRSLGNSMTNAARRRATPPPPTTTGCVQLHSLVRLNLVSSSASTSGAAATAGVTQRNKCTVAAASGSWKIFGVEVCLAEAEPCSCLRNRFSRRARLLDLFLQSLLPPSLPLLLLLPPLAVFEILVQLNLDYYDAKTKSKLNQPEQVT